MEVKSFEELVSTKILGQVWANSISEYYNTFESDFKMSDWKTMLEWSMFGDPTLVVEDGDDPKVVSHSRINSIHLFERILTRFPIFSFIFEKVTNI
jgi:hypothetical protein